LGKARVSQFGYPAGYKAIIMPNEIILVVEDNDVMRTGLQIILEADHYKVLTAAHGLQALEVMHNNYPDLILSDIAMPEMDGFAFFTEVRSHPEWVGIPFIFLTARGERDDIFLGKQVGVEDYLVKPVLRQELLATVRSRLARSQEVYLAQLEQSYQAALVMLANAIEQRDHYSPSHVERVVAYAKIINEHLESQRVQVNALNFGSMLHDIGKILIQDEILQNPEPLTEPDLKEVQRHAEIGARLIENIPYLEPVIPVIRHHHERWDGSGYPEGLVGESIPIEARIVAVADSLDAMITERVYRPAMDIQTAYLQIVAGSGSLYDPKVVEAFQAGWEAIKQIILYGPMSDHSKMETS
jgi:putative two-component system response regulator